MIKQQTALTDRQQSDWEENGFLLLKGFYSDAEIAEVNQLVDQLWSTRETLGPDYVIDIFTETEKEQRVYFRDAPKSAKFAPYKLNDLFLSSELIRNTVAGDRLAPILSELVGGLPMICNSLNFEFGSQQDYHFDTFYMPSPTKNKMIASWIALESATENNGPLRYYPGSHKIPPYLFSNGRTISIAEEMSDFSEYINKEILARNLKPATLMANAGDVLIWHSQLYHGGSPILDQSQTRKSLVTHYFTKADFHDIDAPPVNQYACYMRRDPQPTNYSFFDKP